LYASCNVNTKDGPVVVDLPIAVDAGLNGSILGAWQVPVGRHNPSDLAMIVF
jgi:hypothetical protein